MDPRAAGVRPTIERTVVVLPIPLRPIRVTISPGAIASEIPNSTWLNPYEVSRFSSSMSAGSDMADVRVAQIGPPHLGIASDRVRSVRGDDPAMDQHRDPVGEREHRLHVVL